MTLVVACLVVVTDCVVLSVVLSVVLTIVLAVVLTVVLAVVNGSGLSRFSEK